MNFNFEIKYVKGSLNEKANVLSNKPNYKSLPKKVKLILKLINHKLKSFKLTKKVNINKVIKKTYEPSLKSYLKITKTIKLIKQYITFFF